MIAATALTLTTIDPVTITIFAVVLGAAAVPLTYFPILIVANDARLMGGRVNRRWANAAGTFFMLIMVVVRGSRSTATSAGSVPAHCGH